MTLVVQGLSEDRATIRRLLFCVLKKLKFYGILPSRKKAEQSFEGDIHIRTKSHLPNESRGDTTGPEIARDSASA